VRNSPDISFPGGHVERPPDDGFGTTPEEPGAGAGATGGCAGG